MPFSDLSFQIASNDSRKTKSQFENQPETLFVLFSTLDLGTDLENSDSNQYFEQFCGGLVCSFLHVTIRNHQDSEKASDEDQSFSKTRKQAFYYDFEPNTEKF